LNDALNKDARESIRQAMASEEFARAQRLWDTYAEQVRAAILDGSATEGMMAEMRELVGWSRMVVQSFRAHAGDQVNRAHVARVYDCGNS
jgi:hypothetical protein